MDGLRLHTAKCAEASLPVNEGMTSNESRVREFRTLGSKSGERKRGQDGDRGAGIGARAVGALLLPPSSTSARTWSPTGVRWGLRTESSGIPSRAVSLTLRVSSAQACNDRALADRGAACGTLRAATPWTGTELGSS